MGEEGLSPPSFHFLELMSSLHVSSLPRDLFPWLQQAVAGLHGAAAMCMWGQCGVLKIGRLEIPERLGPLGREGQGTPRPPAPPPQCLQALDCRWVCLLHVLFLCL